MVGYVFDSSGNTTIDAEGRKFTYDSENKQVEVRNASNTTVGEYTYDGDGRRVKKYVTATGETTVFVYSAGGKLVAEYSTVVEPSATAKVNYLTADLLGSPRINTDQNGQTLARHDYHPFGEEVFTAQRASALGYASDTVRKQFTGYERDTEIDLDFAQARYFRSSLGRFTSPDAFAGVRANPQSLNRHSYVINMPLKYRDPSGYFPQPQFLRYSEWVKDTDGSPLWVPHDEYIAKQTERSRLPLWTELNYQSSEGAVVLDPNGPSSDLPEGWTLDGVPVGDHDTPNVRPAPAGENAPDDTATSTPPLITGTGGDPRRNWYFMYLDARARRSRGQALFPDSRGLDAARHRWATRQTALRWGTGTARTFGVLNEVQGFLQWDFGPLLRDALKSYPAGPFVSTRRNWAFQWSDLEHNEYGITDATIIMNRPASNSPR